MPNSTDYLAACRELGAKRLERIANDPESASYKTNDYPFAWGDCWMSTVQYKVNDLASEVGFWIDLMGFQLFTAWENAVMLASPDKVFMLTLVKADNEDEAVRGVCVELMLDNIAEAVAELDDRGVSMDNVMQAPWGDDNPMRTTELKSPAGVDIMLWGQVKAEVAA